MSHSQSRTSCSRCSTICREVRGGETRKWGQLLGTRWHLFESQKKKTLYFQLKDLLQEDTLQ